MNLMSRIFLIRHGESTFNLEKRFTGSTDAPLTEKGEQQAVEAGKLLRGVRVDTVFSSEKIRAKRTAALVAEYLAAQPKVITNPLLNEQNFGDLEGMLKVEADEKFGKKQVYTWRKHPDSCPPNGEPLQEVIDRVGAFYQECLLPKINQGENAIVVGHSNSLRALAKHLLSLDVHEFFNFALSNARPYVIAFEQDKVVNHQYLKK